VFTAPGTSAFPGAAQQGTLSHRTLQAFGSVVTPSVKKTLRSWRISRYRIRMVRVQSHRLGVGLGHFDCPLCNGSIEGSFYWCLDGMASFGPLGVTAVVIFGAQIVEYTGKVGGRIPVPLRYCYRSSWRLCSQHCAEPTDDGCGASSARTLRMFCEPPVTTAPSDNGFA
jgi:hypothetical protein